MLTNELTEVSSLAKRPSGTGGGHCAKPTLASQGKSKMKATGNKARVKLFARLLFGLTEGPTCRYTVPEDANGGEGGGEAKLELLNLDLNRGGLLPLLPGASSLV